MKKLYTVKLETEIVVSAESPSEAEAIGRATKSDEDCCPYGDGANSIKTLVSEGEAPEYRCSPRPV